MGLKPVSLVLASMDHVKVVSLQLWSFSIIFFLTNILEAFDFLSISSIVTI